MRYLRLTLLLFFFGLIANASVAGPKTQSINIIISDCIVGNHMASIQTNYNGRNVEIALYYDGKTKVVINNRYDTEWSDKMRPVGNSDISPMRGKQAIIYGRWVNKNAFEADKVVIKKVEQHSTLGSVNESRRVWDDANPFLTRSELQKIGYEIYAFEKKTGKIAKCYLGNREASKAELIELLKNGGDGGSDVVSCVSTDSGKILVQVAMWGEKKGSLRMAFQYAKREEIPNIISNYMDALYYNDFD